MDRENLFIRFLFIMNLHTTKFCQMDGRYPRQGESCVRVRKTSAIVGYGHETMTVECRYGSST